MTIDKYKLVKGKFINISPVIYKAAQNGQIDFDTLTSEAGVRLDHYSFKYYGDSNNWWIIAAASGIGWWLQVPEGVVLRIPTNLSQIVKLKSEIS